MEFAGAMRRCSLRRQIVIAYHCAPLAGHRSRDKTYQAILDAGLFWPGLRQSVDSLIKQCLQCKLTKGTPIKTALQRSRESDGPFRVIIIDFVGPHHPVTSKGHLYMFTAACVFSGYYWCIPCPDDKASTAARLFTEHVMLDLSGVPAVLCSDRAKAFVSEIVQYVNSTFGIKHAKAFVSEIGHAPTVSIGSRTPTQGVQDFMPTFHGAFQGLGFSSRFVSMDCQNLL